MTSPIIAAGRLGTPPWPTLDPFLFCVHHLDHYPDGRSDMTPNASLAGRNIGMDFEGKNGWRMYHGDTIPGFPRHPHRGFETVTVARKGYIDHSDSLGATARFGQGDAQWMTAGSGIVHSEMFPLVNMDGPNTGELFQLWLNLPAKDKMVDPYFTMFWSETIPVHSFEEGRVQVTTVAGELGGQLPPAPPPNSWASSPDSDLAIWTISIKAGARWEIPPAASRDANRVLYVFDGTTSTVGGRKFDGQSIIQVHPHLPVEVQAHETDVQVLMLQGRPIGEPVAQRGPFVMNTQDEIRQAFFDYRKTGFGGWPWSADGPAHPRTKGRFAIHADGRLDEPKVG